MIKLTNILQEIQIKIPTKLIKGKVYNIYKKIEHGNSFLIDKNIEYSGQNINGDHLFFNHLATNRLNMNWKYINPNELNNYIFIRIK